LTVLTGGVKNLFGLVSDIYKKELHIKYFDVKEFAGILVDIYQEVKPALTVVDGILAMEGDGPGSTGKARKNDFLLSGVDCVAIDMVLAEIMGISAENVPTIREARARGLGAKDLASISILGESLEAVKSQGFKLPTSSVLSNIPKPLAALARKLIRFYPCVEKDNCIGCAACVKAFPKNAMRLQGKRVRINRKDCISCFCCQEACPARAIKIKKSLLAKIIGM
jgi:ferredoxin